MGLKYNVYINVVSPYAMSLKNVLYSCTERSVVTVTNIGFLYRVVFCLQYVASVWRWLKLEADNVAMTYHGLMSVKLGIYIRTTIYGYSRSGGP